MYLKLVIARGKWIGITSLLHTAATTLPFCFHTVIECSMDENRLARTFTGEFRLCSATKQSRNKDSSLCGSDFEPLQKFYTRISTRSNCSLEFSVSILETSLFFFVCVL